LICRLFFRGGGVAFVSYFDRSLITWGPSATSSLTFSRLGFFRISLFFFTPCFDLALHPSSRFPFLQWRPCAWNFKPAGPRVAMSLRMAFFLPLSLAGIFPPVPQTAGVGGSFQPPPFPNGGNLRRGVLFNSGISSRFRFFFKGVIRPDPPNWTCDSNPRPLPSVIGHCVGNDAGPV